MALAPPDSKAPKTDVQLSTNSSPVVKKKKEGLLQYMYAMDMYDHALLVVQGGSTKLKKDQVSLVKFLFIYRVIT
jgi:hypothetical protein